MNNFYLTLVAIIAIPTILALIQYVRDVPERKAQRELARIKKRNDTLDLRDEALRTKITDLYRPYNWADIELLQGKWFRIKGLHEQKCVTHLEVKEVLSPLNHLSSIRMARKDLFINGVSAYDLLLLAENLDGSVFGQIRESGGSIPTHNEWSASKNESIPDLPRIDKSYDRNYLSDPTPQPKPFNPNIDNPTLYK